MKKLLFLGLSTFIFAASNGQEKFNSSVLFQHSNVPVENVKGQVSETGSSRFTRQGKKTRATDRYYQYVQALDTLAGGNGAVLNTNNQSFMPMWIDSTAIINYSSGPGPSQENSVYNLFDPSSPIFNNPSYYAGEMAISSTNTYVIDSVFIRGAYFYNKTSLTGDKLRLSVVKDGTGGQVSYYNLGKTVFPEFLPYYNTTTDTSLRMASPDADSVIKVAGETAASRIGWEYTFTNADTNFIRTWAFKLPTPLSMVAGSSAALSVTFVPGAPWAKNVDTLNGLNHWRPEMFEESNGLKMTYRSGSAGGFDFNQSGYMMWYDSAFYAPAIYIEGINNQPTWPYEHFNVAWHVTCTNCATVGTKDFAKNAFEVNAFPNPAISQVNFSFNLPESAKNVNIEITNAVGQVVKAISLGSKNSGVDVNATINISDLSSGMYMYTINADGQKSSDKIIVQ